SVLGLYLRTRSTRSYCRISGLPRFGAASFGGSTPGARGGALRGFAGGSIFARSVDCSIRAPPQATGGAAHATLNILTNLLFSNKLHPDGAQASDRAASRTPMPGRFWRPRRVQRHAGTV